jgi:hypothetical protein
MKTIINEITGQFLYSTIVEVHLLENEIAIDELPSSDLLIHIWNSSEWIEGITEQELQIRKQQRIEELNKLQYNEMEPYDWHFTRLVRKGTAVPQDILDVIAEIELRYDNLKNEL